jgi:D-inositol-3-phosphate glycosyltransferase
LQDVHVAIIGGDPQAEQLDAEMLRLQTIHRELDLRTLVTFLGAKDQEILPSYYAAADMVVMPSHYESFGMVGLEAMAMGTPVIASRVGGLVHLVQDGLNGYLVPSHTPEALAARILHLLTDEAHRQQLGAQAQRYAHQFSWSKIVDQMLGVYEEVTGDPTAAAGGDW